MKLKMVTVALTTLIAAQLSFAKNINLYDQPQNNAKVVGTVDTETGIIPIYTPKDETWVKVADPRNGNVGWIKSSDLSSTMGSSFNFRVINTGKGPTGYQVIQFSGPQKLKPGQAEALFKQMEMRQKAMQDQMHKMMEDIFSNAHMAWPNFPVIVPVIMMPDKPATNKTTTTKPGETKPTTVAPAKQ